MGGGGIALGPPTSLYVKKCTDRLPPLFANREQPVSVSDSTAGIRVGSGRRPAVGHVYLANEARGNESVI